MKKIKHTTKGKTSTFVAPSMPIDQHRFCVNIPEDESGTVRVIEHTSRPEFSTVVVIHVSLEMRKWIAIADHLQREFYPRGLRPGEWKVGDNLIDRMFGRELCVLAWAIENMGSDEGDATPEEKMRLDEEITTAVVNWLALRPEERWWLFKMTAKSAGWPQDKDHGWKAALRCALGYRAGFR